MKKVLIPILVLFSFSFSDVFMTELTDPQNSSAAGRYVELYNNGSDAVDLSGGWSVQRWTNDNADPTASSVVDLTGSISSDGFYIICNDAGKFSATWPDLTCDQDIGTGGFADSNGDDNMALLNAGVVVDMFGVAGEDGSGTGHEFEDGRAERADFVCSGNPTWDVTEWNVDNDSGGGNGNQEAPGIFDPASWLGQGTVCDGGGDTGGDTGGGSDVDCPVYCTSIADASDWTDWTDSMFCFCVEGCCDGNPGAAGCEDDTYTDCECQDGGSLSDDCAGECGGNAVVDECDVCGGDGSSCVEPEPAANLFFSEASEGSSNNKYLEIYNADSLDVDLGGYSLSSCSNGCDVVGAWDYTDNVGFEAGTMLAAGDVYVVCHGSSDDTILAVCDQTFTYLSNGDDVFALTQVGTDAVLDVIGIVGEDPGSGWSVAGVSNATKDHTIVRKADVITGNALWLDNLDTGEQGSAGDTADNSEWVVFDQNTWDYVGFHPHDFSSDVLGCMDMTACNYNADATVEDGSCATVDCAGECGGDAVCEVAVTFSVDMSIDGVSGDVSVRTSTENGDYMPSDWFVMDDSDGDLVYTYTMMLETSVVYGYNFSDGGYESGDGLADCAGGNYGNDRFVTPGDADMALGTVCFESCEACPAILEGCTDVTATNYNPDATVDNGTCDYPALDAANLFISEAAEGSSNNKYIEIYNASSETVDLSEYAYPTVGNAPTVPGEHENWNTFADGATVASGDVYVICHQSADEFILAECDETYTYLSNGDDGLCLVFGSEANFEVLDCVGDWNADPGSGWSVAGVSNGTKDHTIVRKADVAAGNDGSWEFSAGTSDDDSEWVVLDQNDWTYLGSHPHDFPTCDDVDADGLCDDVDDCVGTYDSCGVCNGSGTTTCWDGSEVCDASTCPAECAYDGDANGDGASDVTDVVIAVNLILSGDPSTIVCSNDMNQDGAVDVVDVVSLVNIILGGGTASLHNAATSADIMIADNSLSIRSEGCVQGVQLTLTHDSELNINLEDYFVSDYVTEGNTTRIMVVSQNCVDAIGDITGDFDVSAAVMANHLGGNVDSKILTVSPFKVKVAGPNPFNPSTSLNVVVPADGYVSVKIYNITGQEVATLQDGFMVENFNGYTLNWNASNLASGVYLVRAESAGHVSFEKLMLLK